MSTLTLLGIDIETLPRKISVDPPLTDAEFESLCLKTDIVQLERTKEGVILMHSPTGAFTGDANAEIIRQLRNWWITIAAAGCLTRTRAFSSRPVRCFPRMQLSSDRKSWKD